MSIGLTGGSTPKAYYKWVAENNPFTAEELAKILWTTSDERYVPADHADNNFTVAVELMLDTLGVTKAAENRLPWPTELEPVARWKPTAKPYRKRVKADLCIVGMGDDCHFLSLFPGSELLPNGSAKDIETIKSRVKACA